MTNSLRWLLPLLLLAPLAAEDDFVRRYAATDEVALLRVGGADRDVVATVRRIGDDAPARAVTVRVADGVASLPVLGEGLHALRFADGGDEHRYLGFAPPPPLDAAAVRRALPRRGERLLAGEPFTLFAMGDSVTETGDYVGILARLIERAVPGAHVRATKRGYAGKSIDASAREWIHDGPPNRPDLGIVMYGLNEEATSYSLDAYLEQCRWLATRLADDCGADALFLTPTPHIELPREGHADVEPWYELRTLGFGAALKRLGEDAAVPVGDAFAAMWGDGGPTLEAAGRAMWPRYPLGYDRQFTSATEADGAGDTIHPNALGHLAIARAALAALAGPPARDPLTVTATARWSESGAVARIVARNAGTERLRGTLHAYPPSRAALAQLDDGAYDLAPGEEASFAIAWTDARAPRDLLRWDLRRLLAHDAPLVPLVDTRDDHSRAFAVAAPFAPDVGFVRERGVAAAGEITLRLRAPDGERTLPFALPDAPVARVPLLRRVEVGDAVGWAAGEICCARFAEALAGEATIDGALDEWRDRRWTPLGEPCQARWFDGPSDHRPTPDEFRLEWTALAGARGLSLALRIHGDPRRDSFMLFLDPRPSAELGTAGRYFWASGGLGADGAIGIGRGETSAAGDPRGAWRATDDGATAELFIPYELMDATAWPADGDLGLSLAWHHVGADGASTWLQWFEDGHPWTPRWYGVVRRCAPGEALPTLVRVE